MFDDDLARRLRILEDLDDGPIARAIQRGDVDAAAAKTYLDRLRAVTEIFASARSRQTTRVQDRKLRSEGLRDAVERDARVKLAPDLEPYRQAARKVIAEHEDFEAKVPFLVRQPDHTFRDTRGIRKLTGEELAIQERRRDRAVAYLQGLEVAERSRVLRDLAEHPESDTDDLLGAAQSAPGYLRLIDDRTKEALRETHVRVQGLDRPLRQSSFLAAAYRDLEASIDQALGELGVERERSGLERLRVDGTLEAIAGE